MSNDAAFNPIKKELLSMGKEQLKKFIRAQIGNGVKNLDQMSAKDMIEKVIIPTYYEMAQEQYVDPEPEDAADLLACDLDDFLEFGDEEDWEDE